MPTLKIDNREVSVDPGATIMDAAGKLGIAIPTLCFLRECAPLTTCMVCVVKVDGNPRLLPACATAAADGMVVESETAEVRTARRTALELLLSDHLGDCIGPCQSVCPAHMEIPQMIRHLAAGRWRDAIVTVKAHIALPAVLGRICPELCEKGCRRGELDSPVGICRLKRFAADADLASGAPYLPACRPETGKKVAIVGAGPAGLAAAWQLRQDGIACTVFDAADQPGGQLRVGVDPARLPRDVLDAEIDVIRRLGVEFQPRVRLGVDVSVDALRQRFDAVLLAVGEVTADTATPLGAAMGVRGLKAERHTHQTPIPNVFAAGSAVTPSRHAVKAVAAGRLAALAMAQHLAGRPIHVVERPYTVHMGRLHECELPLVRQEGSPQGRVAPAGGETAAFADAEMRQEAARCLHCDCLKPRDCRLRECAAAHGASPTRFKGERRQYRKECTHPDVVFEPGKCIACGRCVAITERAGEKLGLAFAGRGFTVKVTVPFDDPLAAGLTKVARECVEACPTAALSWRPPA